MADYYVFRINYDTKYELIRRELLEKNLLRQGWGAKGMDINGDFDSFKDAWIERWGQEDSEEYIKSKYKNLRQSLLKIKPEDYIIIPKISVKHSYVCRSFIVCTCKRAYYFNPLATQDDFGHVIEVDNIFSCKYDNDMSTECVKGKFNAYQRPINQVQSNDFKEAVDKLFERYKAGDKSFEKSNPSYLQKITNNTINQRLDYLARIKNSLIMLGNKEFEKIIIELFSLNGFTVCGTNSYDCKGGDVDIIFNAVAPNSILGSLYECSSIDVEIPKIYVQAKKKSATDTNDIEGINQLIKRRESIPENNPILVLINLTDEFSDDAKKAAVENSILLIDGPTFSSLLVRYGIFR